MNFNKIAKIKEGQDGAIWNNWLFRFDTNGQCFIYDLTDIARSGTDRLCPPVSSFRLDMSDKINPHSNSVMFGKEYYDKEDEFPLLYTNIYNNYAGTDNPLKGVCLVYRLHRNGTEFSSTLVQMIEIGFVEDCDYWRSDKEKEDVRPYGNFTIDTEKGIYYAFVMRDKCNTVRYFSFDLPKACDGTADGVFGVKKVTLGTYDIKEYFDCEYHRFIQGAAFHDGMIYSLEGFTDSAENPPAMRIIDVKSKKQVKYIAFSEMGLTLEPEMIDFADDICYYSDGYGNLYIIDL